MTILITGATGFVGTKLKNFWLEKGHKIHYVTTEEDTLEQSEHVKGFYWNPSKKEIDPNAFIGVTVIVNLAGANISGSWSKKGKEVIYKSRMDVSDTLYSFLSQNKHTVQQVISAAAIGIYPSDFSKIYHENDPEHSTTFLGKVCVDWEKANQRFEKLQIIPTLLRFGLICDKDQGALKPMKQMVNLGLGSGLGTGKQWYSWIHWLDIVRIIDFCAAQKMADTFNCVAPNPLIQKEFTKKLAKKLHRPFFLPRVPTAVLRLALGEKHILITDSQKVACDKLINKGFIFSYPTFDEALRDIFAN